MTEDFKKLYKDNVVVEVLTIIPEKTGYVRKVRSLKADPTPVSTQLHNKKVCSVHQKKIYIVDGTNHIISKYNQTCLIGHLYITNHFLLRAASFFPLPSFCVY